MRYIGTISKYFHYPYEGMFGGGIETIIKEITGTGYTNLTSAVSNGLLQLKAYGGAENKSMLPSEYEGVGYLVFSGGQYINTNINPNTMNTTYQTGIEFSDVSGTQGLFGARAGTGYSDSSCNTFVVSNAIRWDWSGTGTSTETITTGVYYDIICGRKSIKVNNNRYYSSNTASVDISYPFYIGSFSNNSATAFTYGFQGKLFYAKLFNNGSLVFNGIPAKRISDSVLGLYDTVSGTFFTNAGSGSFTSGTTSAIPTPEIPYNIVANNGVLKGVSLVNHSDTQGPAPDGFHVPLISERQAVYDTYTALGLSSGDNFRIYLKMPFAGYRTYSGATLYGKDSQSRYWSASGYANNNASRIYYTSSSINIGINDRGYAFSIRAFKDTAVVPDDSWTTLYGGSSIATGAGIYHNATDGLISISSDGTTWYTIQDKNLGATTVYNDGDTLSEANCGKYYQWGNNYGFAWEGSLTTSSEQVNGSGYGPGHYYSSSTFITSNDWSSVSNDNLWGGVSQGTWNNTELDIHYEGTTEKIASAGKNLFDGGRIDTWIGTQGELQTGSTRIGCITTNNIPCNAGDKITLSAEYGAGAISTITCLCIYDKDGTKLDRYVSTDLSVTFSVTAPANSAYMLAAHYTTAPLTIQLEFGESATDYEAYSEYGNVVCEPLLKLGNYADEQEIISGDITKKVAIKVFDGTENWLIVPGTSGAFYSLAKIDLEDTPMSGSNNIMSSHFSQAITQGTPTLGTFGFGFSYLNVNYDDGAGGVNNFKQWLANQYSAGTPVIIIYPLDTEKSETVDGQTLSIKKGSNIVYVKEASLNGLGLYVKYKGTA